MNAISNDSVVMLSSDIVARYIEDEIIIVPLVTGISNDDNVLFTLNETGKEIWKLLDGKNSVYEIAYSLSQKYNTPVSDVMTDVSGFLDELVEKKLLKIH
jgi:hypothetical protein